MLISRKKKLANKVVFVDGLPGCGKTLFSPIVAAMDRVELLSYAYEIEHYCALYFLDKLPMDAAQAQVRLMTDLQLYDNVMGRRVNFRPSDLSSAFQDHDPSRYLKRLFQEGDSATVPIIEREQPILNLTTHQLLGFSEPIWEALGERCVFVEILRHPLYMIRQQLLNVENLYGSEKSFDVCYLHKNIEVPFFAKGWEDEYLKYKGVDNVICYLDHLSKRTKQIKEKVRKKYNATIITIPFEEFVLDPFKKIQEIADSLESKVTESTKTAMRKQNVPREKVAQGIDIPVYKRCGWVPAITNGNERDELIIRRDEVVKKASPELIPILDRLCKEYEDEYWPSL